MASEMVAATLPVGRKRGGMGRKLMKWGAAVVAGLVVLVVAFSAMGATTGDHTLASIDYGQIPPNSGEHSPVWQKCGFYTEPVGNEHAVHSLEHGVVWIAYRPDLPQAQIDELHVMARSDAELLVSPYPNLPSPLVVSAWERQASLASGDPPLVAEAVQTIRDGLDAPEPGGGCEGPNLWLSGGTGNPER